MKHNQLKVIKWKLEKEGSISRNWALSRYISRLGAYICDLKAEGYKFTAGYKKVKNGRDFVYFLVK